MTTDDIRLLEYYFIPKSWKIYLIDRNTQRREVEVFAKLIENARLFAFDTETMPSFYRSKSPQIKPSLLQVALRNATRTEKAVLLFDLQDIFDQKHRSSQCEDQINLLIESIFNHSQAYKLSQSFYNDLAYLKCAYDESCFQQCKLKHLLELSDLFRRVYLDEKYQQIYSLRRMTAQTLQMQLDKKQQCANWSKRPLSQSLKDYAAMDVIVMIDIYDRLKAKIEEEEEDSWVNFQPLVETSIDLNEIVLYDCVCNQRFLTSKTRTKHMRTCFRGQNQIDRTKKPIIVRSVSPTLDYEAPPPRGRGYLPPALKRAYQTMNPAALSEEIRRSSAAEKCNQLNENRPPDAQFFLEDDDSEVAQAFGLAIRDSHCKPKSNRIESSSSYVSVPKANAKIAAYPPKTAELRPCAEQKISMNEYDLLGRLQDDFDSQPEFHCHLFGLGGRGRSSSLHLSPPSPYTIKRND